MSTRANVHHTDILTSEYVSVETNILLLDELPWKAAVSFAMCDKKRLAITARYNRSLFQLAKALRRTFSEAEVAGLRKLMGHTGALLGGTIALEFFSGGHFKDGQPVDLLVNIHEGLAVYRWLEEMGFSNEVAGGDIAKVHTGHDDDDAQKCTTIPELFRSWASHLPRPDHFKAGGDGVAFMLVSSRRQSVVPVRVIVTIFNPFQVVLSLNSSEYFRHTKNKK